MSTSPGMFERQAAEEREHLHGMATEIKVKIAETRENLKIATNMRRYFASSALAVSGIGLLAGYLLAGIFTRK